MRRWGHREVKCLDQSPIASVCPNKVGLTQCSDPVPGLSAEATPPCVTYSCPQRTCATCLLDALGGAAERSDYYPISQMGRQRPSRAKVVSPGLPRESVAGDTDLFEKHMPST